MKGSGSTFSTVKSVKIGEVTDLPQINKMNNSCLRGAAKTKDKYEAGNARHESTTETSYSLANSGGA